MKKTVLMMTTAALLSSAAVWADNNAHNTQVQYTGPIEKVTVASLLESSNMFTEHNAVVEGHLIKQINAEKFLFSDGTQQIQVDLDDDIHLPQKIDANTKVRLFGEYEGGKTPEIEVDKIEIL